MNFFNLSRHDAITTLEILYNIIEVECFDSLSILFDKCKKILPFDKSLYGFALRNKTCGPYYNNIIECRYPKDWMEEYVKNEYHNIDPVYRYNMSRFGLQQWKETYKIIPPPDNFLKKALSFDLCDGYTFGLPDRNGHFASLFSISGYDLEFNSRDKKLVNILFSYFHTAIEKISSKGMMARKNNNIFVTKREIEVLKWLMDGKTTWEISNILNISENTVKYHIKKMLRKFGVYNRVHLISVVMTMKLL